MTWLRRIAPFLWTALLALLPIRAVVAADEGDFSWMRMPLPQGDWQITQGDEDSCRSTHCSGANPVEVNRKAFDLSAAGIEGQPVLTPAAGTLIAKGWEPWGGGNFAIIEHATPSGGKVQSLYFHLQSPVDLELGAKLPRAGIVFAHVGHTGSLDPTNQYGPHLHFSLVQGCTYGTIHVGCQGVKVRKLDGQTNVWVYREPVTVVHSSNLPIPPEELLGGWWLGPTPSDGAIVHPGDTVNMVAHAFDDSGAGLDAVNFTASVGAGAWETRCRFEFTSGVSSVDLLCPIAMPAGPTLSVSFDVYSRSNHSKLAPQGMRRFCGGGRCSPITVDETRTGGSGSGGGAGDVGFCISGFVTGPAGPTQPKAGVAVTAEFGSPTSTDGNGAYRLCGFTAGTYHVTPSLAGSLMLPPVKAVVVGPDAAQVNFVAAPDNGGGGDGGCIAGFVTGPAGAPDPRPGASIRFSDGRTASTGTDGRYQLCQFGGGAYTVTPSLSGFDINPASKSATSGDLAVNFLATRSTPPYCVRGFVTGPAGPPAPVGGVTIVLGDGRTTLTAGNGSYSFCGLVGDTSVRANDSRYVFNPPVRSIVAGPPDREQENFTATPPPPTFCISGYVTGSQGVVNPIPGAAVSVSGPDSAVKATGADGRYEACGLHEGNYGLAASKGAELTCGPNPRNVFLSGANQEQQNFVCNGAPKCQSPAYPISPGDSAYVPPGQAVTLQWPATGPGCRYTVLLFDGCGSHTFAALQNASLVVDPRPTGTRCGWQVQGTDENGQLNAPLAQWYFTWGTAPPSSTAPPNPTTPPAIATTPPPVPTTPAAVPTTPPPTTFVPHVETYSIPPEHSTTETYITFGAYFDLNTQDPKWAGRPVHIHIHIHTGAGQPAAARIFIQAQGLTLIEFPLNDKAPDQWTDVDVDALAGSHRYELEVHGHPGWSSDLNVWEGQMVVSNQQ